ncbi:MAG: DUF456 family protein [Planctomycetota bacterium]
METFIELLLVGTSWLLALLGLLLIVFSLPGNWLLALVGLFGFSLGLGWMPLIILVAAAAVAELLELVVGAGFAKKAGGGKAAMWGTIVGGIVGAILFTPLIPIPILGTLLGAAVGAAGGAIAFELLFAKEESERLLEIGVGAFLGTLFGKGLKLAIGVFQAIYWFLQTTAVVGEKMPSFL